MHFTALYTTKGNRLFKKRKFSTDFNASSNSGGYKPDPKVEHYGKEGGASMEGGFKFTDKQILDPLTSLTESTYSAKSRESLDIKPVNLEDGNHGKSRPSLFRVRKI